MANIQTALETLAWRQVPEKAVAIYQKHAETFAKEWQKEAYSPTLNTMAQWLNITPGHFPGGIPNSPSPLTSMLVGGLAGAGIGYGLGTIGEHLMPDSWQRNRLRRTLAALGGLAGTAPGALWGTSNVLADRDFNSDAAFQQNYAIPETLRDEVKQSFHKMANLYEGSSLGGPAIDVEQFMNDVWQNPNVSGPMSPREQAAATGLVAGAANLPGKQNSRYVTPMDIGRMAAGMGSGYLSGMLVGKALGILTGMPQGMQDVLKQTGMYAGIVKSIVPIAFGG